MPGLALAWPGACLLATCILCISCSDRSDEAPPRDGRDAPSPATAEAPRSASPRRSARPDLVEALREDIGAPRHPSDGGGRAWLDPGPGEHTAVTVSTPGRWTIVYEAGPLGIAEKGVIFLQVSPFWGWSTPQVTDERMPGFTTITTEAKDVTLTARTLAPQLLGIEVSGRALVAGERVRIVYGAGEAGAVADRYAERGSRLWIAVDGDGDGVRKLIDESPAVTVLAGRPDRLQAILPSTAHPGETVRLHLAVLDGLGSAGVDISGDLVITPSPGLEVASHVTLSPDDGGRVTVPVTPREAGMYRLRVSGPADLVAESNPMEVSATGPRVLWGDLHGHSNLSDGTGLPEDYFRYARDIAALDVAALSDHDHWGMQFIDSHPELWEAISRETKRFHEPGRFVTLLAYEWTSWLYGHRHVLYFTDSGPLHSSIDPRTETPAQLWAALAGQEALTVAHHSAGGPIATDWSFAPDPLLEPVTEVVSVHGSSEAEDSPGRIYDPVPGNFVRDALDLGYRFGFVGSGDSHDGHPGNAHLAARTGGVAAILSEELTRPAVLEALRSRRVYATSGARILLRFSLAGARMGTTLALTALPPDPEALVRAVGTGPLERIDIIQSGKPVESLPCDGAREVTLSRAVNDLTAGGYVYVRVVQTDGGLAWSSPVYLE